MNKKQISQLIKKVKDTKKTQVPTPAPKLYRERDMRQEAMDIGAHGAKEIWGSDGTRN